MHRRFLSARALQFSTGEAVQKILTNSKKLRMLAVNNCDPAVMFPKKNYGCFLGQFITI